MKIYTIHFVFAVYSFLCGSLDEHGIPKKVASLFEHEKYNIEEIRWKVCALTLFHLNSRIKSLWMVVFHCVSGSRTYSKRCMKLNGDLSLRFQESGMLLVHKTLIFHL